MRSTISYFFFFFNDTATTEIYTLSLHDALPISVVIESYRYSGANTTTPSTLLGGHSADISGQPQPVTLDPSLNRSEEHTSELQSQSNLVCRLLLEKKKNLPTPSTTRQTLHRLPL